MANAINWIRSKAKVHPSMSDTLEYEGETYVSEWSSFKGNLPYRMRKELSGAKLVNEEFENETLRIISTGSGHQTGEVEYIRVTYRKACPS